MTRILLQTWTNVSAKIHLTTPQAVAPNAPEILEFPGVGPEDWDPLGMHDPVVNPSRLTVPVGMGGRWSVKALAKFPPDGSGTRSIIVWKNGDTGTEVASGKGNASVQGLSGTSGAGEVLANPGDYFELEVNNNGMEGADITTAQLIAEYKGPA